MEIGAAFMVGAIAGGWVANSMASVKGSLPPPPPPPLPPIERKRTKIVNLHIEQILDPSTGEDIRTCGNITAPMSATVQLPAPTAKPIIKLSDIAQASANLKRAPRPLTMDEKRLAFTAAPLFVELLKTTPQAQ